MKIKLKNGIELEMWSNSDIPIANYETFNKYAILDAASGGGVTGHKDRLNTLGKFIGVNDEKAKILLENTIVGLNFIEEGVNLELKSFICLIKCIEGKRLTLADLTEQGIENIEQLIRKSNTSNNLIRSTINSIKKKLNWN